MPIKVVVIPNAVKMRPVTLSNLGDYTEGLIQLVLYDIYSVLSSVATELTNFASTITDIVVIALVGASAFKFGKKIANGMLGIISGFG